MSWQRIGRDGYVIGILVCVVILIFNVDLFSVLSAFCLDIIVINSSLVDCYIIGGVFFNYSNIGICKEFIFMMLYFFDFIK